MEQVAIFQEKVSLEPIDLHRDISSFDEVLLAKLKQKLEGKCSKHGFVIPGSLQLLSRSMGFSEKGRGTADFLYYLKAQGKVYNPPDGSIVEGEIVLHNKLGCYVILDNAIRIMIPRDLHIGNEEFDSLAVGERIRIEIKRSKFRANATHILSIGQYLGRVGEVPVEQGSIQESVETVVQDSGEEAGQQSAEGEGSSDSDQDEE